VTAVSIRFLNRAEVGSLALDADDLVQVVESGLRAHGRGETVLPPKGHLVLDHLVNGHFNILSGYVSPIGRAGVKVIGDYVDNWRHGLPSEVALLTLYEPATGVPLCIMDATALTWQRTGAVTCVGAKHLARPESSVVAHLGARGTAFENLRLLSSSFRLDEIRVVSARPETRSGWPSASRVNWESGPARWRRPSEAVEGADIIIEATRLETPQILIPADAVKPGALVVTYGWIMAVDPVLPFAADKLVVDDWAQCQRGGALHPLIESGQLTAEHVHAEIGQVVAGSKAGRERDDERIVFWHRGFAVSDIVLGHALHERAMARGIGTVLHLFDAAEE
jgi:ornithine cyclodeaminase